MACVDEVEFPTFGLCASKEEGVCYQRGDGWVRIVAGSLPGAVVGLVLIVVGGCGVHVY